MTGTVLALLEDPPRLVDPTTPVLRADDLGVARGESVFETLRLAGGRPAHPCAWLDLALTPGAHRGLRGRAGVRCAPRSDGVLRLGPAAGDRVNA